MGENCFEKNLQLIGGHLLIKSNKNKKCKIGVIYVINFEEQIWVVTFLKKILSLNFNKWTNIIYQQYKSVIMTKF